MNMLHQPIVCGYIRGVTEWEKEEGMEDEGKDRGERGESRE